MSDVMPWERQPKETRRAFEYFRFYRDMAAGKRSQREVAEHFHRSMTAVNTRAVRYKWVERSTAWDSERDRVKREAQLGEIAQMSVRHAQTAQAMTASLMKPVEAFFLKLKNEPNTIEKMSKQDVDKLLGLINRAAYALPALTNVERLSRGLPTEKREHSVEGLYFDVAGETEISAALQILISAGSVRVGGPKRPEIEMEPVHSPQTETEAVGLLTSGRD